MNRTNIILAASLIFATLSAQRAEATPISVEFSFSVQSIEDTHSGNPAASNPYNVTVGDVVIVDISLDPTSVHFGSAYYDAAESLTVSVHGNSFSAEFPAQNNEVSTGFDPGTASNIWSFQYGPATVDPSHLGPLIFEFRDPSVTANIGIDPLPLSQWSTGRFFFVLWDPSATIDLQNGYRIDGDPSSLTSPAEIPEPATVTLVATGLAVAIRRRAFALARS